MYVPVAVRVCIGVWLVCFLVQKRPYYPRRGGGRWGGGRGGCSDGGQGIEGGRRSPFRGGMRFKATGRGQRFVHFIFCTGVSLEGCIELESVWFIALF